MSGKPPEEYIDPNIVARIQSKRIQQENLETIRFHKK